MAILLDEKTIKLGHIDGFVFRKVNGKIVTQSMPSQYTDANSPAQQKQRSGMRNILAFYRLKLLRELIKEQFKEVDGRAYNNFVSRNLKLEAVELSEKDYKNDRCILAPYIISEGTLPPLNQRVVDSCLQVKINGKEWKRSDILRLIRIEGSESSGNAPMHAIGKFEEKTIYKPVDQTITTPSLPHGAYAFVHVRYRSHDNLKVSTEHLMIV